MRIVHTGAHKLAARGGHICKNYLILSIFEQIVIGQLNIVMWRLQDAYLRVRSAGTIRAITSLPWMLQCQRSVIIKVLDPPISNENRAHWGMNPSKWSINYETFPSHKGRKLLASQYQAVQKMSRFSGFLWRLQDAYLRVRSAGTIREITSLPWMLQCQRSVIIKVLDPPISNENRAHWGMNPSKWSIIYETFPSHKRRKLLASQYQAVQN